MTNHDSVKLYQWLQNQPSHRPQKIVQITACHAGAGTTTLARRLSAIKGAQASLMVSLRERKDAKNEIIIPERPQNGSLWQTDIALDGSAFLDRLFLGSLWDRFRQHADLIFLDTPPLSESSLALAIAPTVDTLLLVVEAEKTPRHLARDAFETLTVAGVKVIGVVLNKQRPYLPRFFKDRI